MKKLIALLLAVLLLAVMPGCGALLEALIDELLAVEVVPYAEMEYTRPDPAAVEAALESAVALAESSDDADAVMEGVWELYDAYDVFYTNYSLADLRYCADLTDPYWEEEYNYCLENSGTVDAALEELYYALAASSCRKELEEEFFGEGYFESYDGENSWDEGVADLLQQESELETRYYELSEQMMDYEPGSQEGYDACADGLAQLLAELIAVRQKMAAHWGYDSYSQFASDFYYSRDYTAEEFDGLLESVRQELVPLYRRVCGSTLWEDCIVDCTEEETLEYLRVTAENMGGAFLESHGVLTEGGLYDIAYGEYKYSGSFEVFLYTYGLPVIFMNPTLTNYDFLTFAHEFGHFCNEYVCYGSYSSIDVMEILSQGTEYLSLCYGPDMPELTALKMADSLSTYVEQAAFACFENRMYELTGDDLSAEGLCALYEEVALAYGFDSVGYDRREFVDITHYYTLPMYIPSYVVSNDAALQIYQMELAEEGAGLALLDESMYTTEYTFMSYLDSVGLESPFAEGRMEAVRRTLEEALREQLGGGSFRPA